MTVTNSHRSLAAMVEAEHDLRQPLHSLLLLHAALDRCELDDAARAISDNLGRAVEAMREMVDGLTMMGKLDAGSLEPAPVTVAVQRLFDWLHGEYGSRAAGRNSRLRVVTTSLAIESDFTLLRPLIGALVSNAVAHMRDGRILVGARRRADRAWIEIWDTGPGIRPEDGDRIFERFQPPAAERAGRLGLGLTLARGLAALLKHELTFRSWPGRGSVFRVAAPLASSATAIGVDDDLTRAGAGAIFGRSVVFLGDAEIIGSVEPIFARWNVRCARVEGARSLRRVFDGTEFAPDLIVVGAEAGQPEHTGTLIATARAAAPD